MKSDTATESFRRSYAAGTVIFREGEPGTEMYVIHSGKVLLTRRVKDREAEVGLLPAGEFFGEMAILNQRPHVATATVVEDAELLVLDAKTFVTMVTKNAEISLRMLMKLSQRLDQTGRQVEALLHREHNHRVVVFLCREAECAGIPCATGTMVPITDVQIADRLGLTVSEVRGVLNRLELSRLLTFDAEGNIVVCENGKLLDFLDFLDMKEKFWRDGYRKK